MCRRSADNVLDVVILDAFPQEQSCIHAKGIEGRQGAAAEFTFFLAIPVMLGASLLKVIRFGLAFSMAEAVILLVGMAIAFVVSVLVIRFLMGYIKKHDFKVFGWYRIVLGILVLLYFFVIKQ